MVCSFFFYTNAQITSSKHNLQIINVNTENYPEAIFVEFTVTNDSGKFVSGLQEKDFIIKDNSTKKYSCKRLIQELNEYKYPIDIVFLMDNSGTMDDEQKRISETLNDLLNGLSEKGDVRVALARFGHTVWASDLLYNGEYIWADIIKANYTSVFSPLRNKKDIDQFTDDIWGKNNLNGIYEPYYNALKWVAEQQLDYREDASKIFIMIGDEAYNDYYYIDENNENCFYDNVNNDYEKVDETTVSKILNENNIQTFIIQNPNFITEYNTITQQTNGKFYDVTQWDNKNILADIATKVEIKENYVLRYCVETDNTSCEDAREITIILNKDTVSNNYYPIKSATIERTEKTCTLDYLQVENNTPIELSAIVSKNGNQIDTLKLFYLSEGKLYEKINTDCKVINDNQQEYSFTIPAEHVSGTHIAYYFETNAKVELNDYSIVTKITSPAHTHELFTWTIAINPCKAPIISNVNNQIAVPCRSINISANVTDDNLETVMLDYRMSNIDTDYKNVEMIQQLEDHYIAFIPAESAADASIEYFIVATDKTGLQAHYGTPENPIIQKIEALSVASKQDPMEILIYGLDRITIGCNPITEKDTIAAYYPMRCGGAVTDVLCSYATWDKLIKGFRLTVYGTSSNSNVKNGFEKGDDIKLKLIQNGIDYILENHNIKYSPNARITDFPYIAIGPKEPKASFYIENKQIERDSDIDFGSCDRETTKIITLKNTGCENLYIRDIKLDNELFEIKLIETEADKEGILKILAPGESVNIDISYTPTFDANATLEIHTNIPSDHIYRFTLSGKSLTVSPCATLKMQPLTPKYGENISLTFDARQEKEIEILLKKECSYKVDWSYTLTPSVRTQEVQIDKLLEIGHYKLSFYLGENLCEYLFEVIE